MHRATLGILAGLLGSAIGTVWWTRRCKTMPTAGSAVTHSDLVIAEYARLADGII
jgi:hypothetical protein